MISARLRKEVEGEGADGEGEIQRWKEVNLKKVLCLVLGILTYTQYFSFWDHALWFSGLTPGSAFRITPDGVREDPILL